MIETMIRFWIGSLQLAELFVSAVIHVLYGLYIFSTAIASDISQALNDWCIPRKNGDWFWVLRKSVAGEPANIISLVHQEKLQQGRRLGSDDLPPIVLVHGIFGFGQGRLGGLSYFAGAEKKDERVLVPDLGSLTSIYDRARELFYYLKGGQVDYGEEHSKHFGHSQFGNTYDYGHFPEWDDQNPVHFVGHSAGVQVIRVLQQMLAEKAFKSYENTSENWVLSVTSLSGALNGTTRTYLDGMELGVTIYDWFNIQWLKKYYNFGFDHFNMSWRRLGFSGLIDCLLGNTGPFASGDWILPDLTIQGSLHLNCSLDTFPNTYYFSYATKRTRKFMGITVPSSILGIHPLLFIRILQMSQWCHPSIASPPYKGYRDEDWQDNDGAINTASMTHPRLPIEHPSCFVEKDSEHQQPLQPGIWYYKIIEADHIMFIVNRERAGVEFDMIYDSIFQRCRKHISRTATLTH